VLHELDAGDIRVLRVRPADERRAREILERFDDKEFSYVDATSFAVMERSGIPAAFTFDDDFRQFGLIDLSQSWL
jgi:predicted nucleic acid-binding protein